MEFSHACFQKDQPYLLEHIKRKIANPKSTVEEKGTLKPEAVNKVMSEVKLMRGRQDTLDSRFSAMKQENEALWREVAVLRQKHVKQQQIVNKLIQFLVTIVQPTRNNSGLNSMAGVKRRYQLMINDVPESQSSAKVQKQNDQAGPIIHELTEELFDDDHNYSVDEIISSPTQITSPSSTATGGDIAATDYVHVTGPKTFKIEQTDPLYVDHIESDPELIEESVDAGNMSYIINEITPDIWMDDDAPALDSTIIQPEPAIMISEVKSSGKPEQPVPTSNVGNKSILNSNRKAANKKVDKQKKPILYLKTSDGRKAKVGEKLVQSNIVNKNKPQIKLQVNGKNMYDVGAKSCDDGAGSSGVGAGSVGKNPKVYKDKNDFISTEIPNELFDSQVNKDDMF